jgi:hypothetical protein
MVTIFSLQNAESMPIFMIFFISIFDFPLNIFECPAGKEVGVA